MNSNEQYLVRVERYNGVSVTIYEIGGKEYLTAEDIGRCLGLVDPKQAVKKIYSRNREELDPQKGGVRLTTPGGVQEVVAYTETGANLIAMFSRTPKARDFRLWLARLPRKVRDAAPALAHQVLEARREGIQHTLRLLEWLKDASITSETLGQLIWLRRRGFSQKETGRLLVMSKDQVQFLEKRLKDLGVEFAPVNHHKRQREIRNLLVETLADAARKEAPALPAPESGHELC
jgi:prophage antirepressor-like protein